MDKTLQLADEIAGTISKSDIYKEYLKAKNEIINNPELFEKMKKFKEAHNEFCHRREAGEEIPLYDEINVSRMYFELLRYNCTESYLKNEQLLIKLMSQVYEHLSKACVEIFSGFEV